MTTPLRATIYILIVGLGSFFFQTSYGQDGMNDPGFDPGTGANAPIYTTAIQSDGKIIIAGDFTSYDGNTVTRLARLNADGGLDTTFNPGSGANDVIIITVVQSDGKIIIGGDFTTYNGIGRNSIARVNPDGTLDTSFDPGTGVENSVFSVLIQPDGKIIIAGFFTIYNGFARRGVARLNTDGSLDTSFDPGTGINSNGIIAGALQSNGKVIIGGGFTAFNGTAINRIARLNADGTLDLSFNPGTGPGSQVQSLAIQGDGKILVGGIFTDFNSQTANRIARLNADGTLDASFDTGTGADNGVRTISIQSDEKIVIGGFFTVYNGTSRNRIARLDANGGIDFFFDPGTGADNFVWTSAIQSDGKIIAAGLFNTYNGLGRNRINRIAGSTSSTQTVITSDSLALVALYNSTNGPGWTRRTNWLTGPVNTWQGITVQGGRVNTISLSINGLIGSLPSQLENLTSLEFLYLQGNKITGNIPVEIANLPGLISASIVNNYFDFSALQTLVGNPVWNISNQRLSVVKSLVSINPVGQNNNILINEILLEYVSTPDDLVVLESYVFRETLSIASSGSFSFVSQEETDEYHRIIITNPDFPSAQLISEEGIRLRLPAKPPMDITFSSLVVPCNTDSIPVAALGVVGANNFEFYTFEFVNGSGDDDNESFIINDNLMVLKNTLSCDARSVKVRVRATQTTSGATIEKGIQMLVRETNFQTQQLSLANPNVGVDEIIVVDELTVWVLTQGNEINRTIDGGVNWLNVSIPDATIGTIWSVSPDSAWVTIPPFGVLPAGVYATIDGGQNWSRQPTAYNGGGSLFPDNVYFFNSKEGFTLGDFNSAVNNTFEMYTTINGGTNWIRVPASNIEPAPGVPFDYSLTTGRVFDAVGDTLFFISGMGRFYRSVDKGFHWTTPAGFLHSTSTNVGFVEFTNSRNGILGYDNGLYKTTDGGDSWELIAADNFESTFVHTASIPGSNNILTAHRPLQPNQHRNNIVTVTSNYGMTELEAPISDLISNALSVGIASSGLFWVGVFYDQIIKYSTQSFAMIEIMESGVVKATGENVDFAQVNIGDDQLRDLQVFNTGDATMVITDSQVTGDYSLLNPLPSSIPAGESVVVTVRFSPIASGVRNGTFTITSNADIPVFTMNLSGVGELLVTIIEVKESGLSKPNGDDAVFTSTDIGEEQFKQIEILNTGNSILIVTDIQVTGDYSLQSAIPEPIDAGNSVMLRVRFAPTGLGVRTGKLTILSNGDVPVFTINLLGEGDVEPEVYNVVTTRQDGKHDFLNIKNITFFPRNKVSIFDRWGNKVFEQVGYDNVQGVFAGVSSAGRDLPESTYYYVIDKNNGDKHITGFLFLKR